MAKNLLEVASLAEGTLAFDKRLVKLLLLVLLDAGSHVADDLLYVLDLLNLLLFGLIISRGM